MQSLFRRPSGVYVTRLVVPQRLRAFVGKRELIRSTGSHDLALAKIVATAQLADWRRQFFDADRMRLTSHSMNHESIVKIAAGHPALSHPGFMSLAMASAASGIEEDTLLRESIDGHLALYVRLSGVQGASLNADDLEVDDAEIGTRLVPSPSDMPTSAQRRLATGVYEIDAGDLSSVAGQLLAGVEHVGLILVKDQQSGRVFVPERTIELGRAAIEVKSLQVEAMRRAMSARIDPDELEHARSAFDARLRATATSTGKHAEKLLSEAIKAYATQELPDRNKHPRAVAQRRRELELIVEFEGDLKLADIDTDVLLGFRDDKLPKMLANENRARLKLGTTSMSQSMKAVDAGWPKLSIDERSQRVAHIVSFFAWLTRNKWITDDPATALRGRSGASKAEKIRANAEKAPRKAFTTVELKGIFSAPWYKTGRGELTAAGTYRTFQPFQYWLPLLGLLGGCRIGEGSQLWLKDIQRTMSGTWYFHINQLTADKSLKNDWSDRKVPIHPLLLNLGFIEYCDALGKAGYRRLFPELSWFEVLEYSKEPVRKHSDLFKSLGMVRDGTKVFHCFRRNLNIALEGMPNVKDTARLRIMGHLAGDDVNSKHYLEDRNPDETNEFMRLLELPLPPIAAFDVQEGLRAVASALSRKAEGRGAQEDLGAPVLAAR